MAHTPYSKVGWKILPDKSTPASIPNMKHMDDGIKEVSDGLKAVEEDIVNAVFFEEIGTIDETTGEITLNSNNSNTTNNEDE